MTIDTSTDVRRHGHRIGGAEIGEATIERRSPASGELLAVYADATSHDVDLAVRTSRAAFDSVAWQDTAHGQRADLLDELVRRLEREADHLAAIDSAEVGKPLAFAAGDVGLGIAHARQAAAIARTAAGESFPGIAARYTAIAERRAVGVVGLIVPWNFPGLITLQKLPYALAAGCAVVIKPSEFTSGSALEIARIVEESGFPAGLVNVVTGYGHTAGHELVAHPGVNYVSFTGSTRTGRAVASTAAANLTRVGLELGGKTANVVFADADLAEAAESTVFGAFANQGESCVATSRLIVDASVADELVSRVVALTRDIVVGLPDDPAADIGSLIHHAHRDSVAAAVEAAKAAGGVVEVGGAVPTAAGLQDGAFYLPTVVSHVDPDSALFQQEVFGPVLAVTTFDDEEDAVRLANATSYGLAQSLWTTDLNRALTVGRKLEAGTVWVNTCSDGSPALAFGGVKSSGYGRDGGVEGYLEFTEYRTLQVRGERRPSPFTKPGPS